MPSSDHILANVTTPLQTMLSAGNLSERDGRYLARCLKENPGLDAAALLVHLKLAKAAAAQAKEQEKAVLEAVRGPQDSTAGGGLLSAGNKPSEQAASGNGSTAPQRSGAPAIEPMPINNSSAVPSQRHAVADGAQDAAEQEDRQPRTLPYDDPIYVAMHLGLEMEPADYVETARLMTAGACTES